MDFSNIFRMDYWFSQPQLAAGLALWLFLIGFLGLIILGVLIRIYSFYQKEKAVRNLHRRLGALGMVMGLLGLAWLFFRQEQAGFLAWRFWLLLWLLVFVWWLSGIVRYMVTRLPAIKKEHKERQEKEKYF